MLENFPFWSQLPDLWSNTTTINAWIAGGRALSKADKDIVGHMGYNRFFSVF